MLPAIIKVCAWLAVAKQTSVRCKAIQPITKYDYTMQTGSGNVGVAHGDFTRLLRIGEKDFGMSRSDKSLSPPVNASWRVVLARHAVHLTSGLSLQSTTYSLQYKLCYSIFGIHNIKFGKNVINSNETNNTA